MLLGNMQDKIIQVCSPSLICFFNSVCQSIATDMFVYFVRAHVCLSVSVDVAFYFGLGFGSDGVCILTLGDVGLSMDFVFWGWGVFFLNWVLFGGWGWFYFDFLGDSFFLSEFFFFVFFFFCGGTSLIFV